MSRRIQCVYRNNDAIDCEAMRAVEDMNLRVSEDIGRLAAQVLKKMIDKKEKDVFAYYLVEPIFELITSSGIFHGKETFQHTHGQSFPKRLLLYHYNVF